MSLDLDLYTEATEQENILSILTVKKKSQYNLSVLFNALKKEMQKINRMNKCHLSTYPCIGVHVENINAKYLMDNKDEICMAVQRVLTDFRR